MPAPALAGRALINYSFNQDLEIQANSRSQVKTTIISLLRSEFPLHQSLLWQFHHQSRLFYWNHQA